MAIEVGSQVQGKVTNITNFGAFVDLGDDKTGLIHISEIANYFVNNINEELERGDLVTVKVLKIEDNGNIALSIKQSDQPNQTAELKASRSVSSQDQQEASPVRRPEAGAREGHASSKASHSPRSNYSKGTASYSSKPKNKQSFDDLMSNFLKDSEERLTSLKRNTEHKRGGRGGRRG